MALLEQKPASKQAWAVVAVLLSLFYGFVLYVHAGKYQEAGTAYKYEICAEAIKRVLFTGDVEGLAAYYKDRLEFHIDTPDGVAETIITDERPLFHLYFALIKLMNPAPVQIHFFIGIVLLLWSVILLCQAFDPPDKPLFVLLGGLLMSPYFMTLAFQFESHTLQIFFTCCSLYLYTRTRYFWSLFFMTCSFFTHGANMPLVGCLGLYGLLERPFSMTRCIQMVLGCIAAWLMVELFLFILASMDHWNLFAHTSFIENFLFKSGRIRAEFSQGEGIVHYVKSLFILMPLGVAGVFLARTGFEAAFTVAPLLLFAVVTRMNMPAEVRVLAPIFFVASGVFLLRALQWKSWPARCVLWGLIAFAGAMSACFLAVAAKSTDLSVNPGEPVALCAEHGKGGSWLHWNLRRYHPVQEGAASTYCLTPLSRLDVTNIPDANTILANLVFIVVDKAFGRSVVEKLGSLNPFPPVYKLSVTTRGAP